MPGGKPENVTSGGLERTLGTFSASSIVVANMIGAGIFTTTGLLVELIPDPIFLLGLWFLGGLIALAGALSYGYLGAIYPDAGGEYLFLSRIYHPLPGFLSGWVSFFVGFTAPIAAAAIGFVEYLIRILDSAGQFSESWNHPLVRKGAAVLVIFIFTAVHRLGMRTGSRVQNVLTILKVGVILGLLGAGFAFGKGSLQHLFAAQPESTASDTFRSAGLALMWILFAYSGWNAATYIGAEIRRPEKTLPASLMLGTGTVMLLYLLLNVFYFYAVPLSRLKGVLAVVGEATRWSFGVQADVMMSSLVALALFSSLSAFIILGPRVYYAMARDGVFFPFAARVDERRKVPHISIWLQGALACLFVLTGSFDQILTYMGFALGIFPLLTVAAVFTVRARTGKKPPGFPWVQGFYIVLSGTVLVLAFQERPYESTVAILTVLAGIPAYFFFQRKYEMR